MGWTSKAPISETGRLHCDIPRCTKADTGWLKGSIIFYKAGRSRKHCRAESMLGKSEARGETANHLVVLRDTSRSSEETYSTSFIRDYSSYTRANLGLIPLTICLREPEGPGRRGEARVSLTFDLRGRLTVNAGYSSVIRDFIRYYLSCPAARPPSQSSS